MKKWRNLTDDEVQEELEQIALERQIIEDATFGAGGSGGSERQPYPDSTGGVNVGTEDDVEDDIDDVDIEEEVM